MHIDTCLSVEAAAAAYTDDVAFFQHLARFNRYLFQIAIPAAQTVTVIEDRDKLDDLKAKRDDLRQASKMLYIRETDLSGMPVVGAGVTYEERRYRVMECSLEEGMYVILLGEVRR